MKQINDHIKQVGTVTKRNENKTQATEKSTKTKGKLLTGTQHVENVESGVILLATSWKKVRNNKILCFEYNY